MKIPRNIQNQYSESKTKFPKPTPKTTNKIKLIKFNKETLIIKQNKIIILTLR